MTSLPRQAVVSIYEESYNCDTEFCDGRERDIFNARRPQSSVAIGVGCLPRYNYHNP
jgi:hypothetical protein